MISRPTVVYALHAWQISIFSKTTEASSSKIYIRVVDAGIYTLAVNDIVRQCWSAENRVHATAAVTDFTVTK